MKFVNEQNPLEHEGIVVVDRNLNKVKVKSAAYIAFNKARDIVRKSPRGLLELILLEKLDDILPMLSNDYKEYAINMQERIRVLFHQIEHNFHHCKRIADTDMLYCNPRKAFCLEATKQKMWLDPLISRFIGKCENFHGYINSHKRTDGTINTNLLDHILSLI
jgi:hypothetical protein